MKNPKKASMVLKKVVELKSGKKSGTIKAIFDGCDPSGKPIMTETRTITFHSDPELRIIDYEIRIDPKEKLIFGDTKEGTFGYSTGVVDGRGSHGHNGERRRTKD